MRDQCRGGSEGALITLDLENTNVPPFGLSLDSEERDETQRVWAAEAIRRRDEIRSGEVRAVPGEQVLYEVRLLVGR